MQWRQQRGPRSSASTICGIGNGSSSPHVPPQATAFTRASIGCRAPSLRRDEQSDVHTLACPNLALPNLSDVAMARTEVVRVTFCATLQFTSGVDRRLNLVAA